MQISERIRCNGLSLVPRFETLPPSYYRQEPKSRGSNELMRPQLDGPNSAPANSLSDCDFIHRRTFTRPRESAPRRRSVVNALGGLYQPGRTVSVRAFLLERTPFSTREPLPHSHGNGILISFDLISRYLASQASCPEADSRNLPVRTEIVAVADKRINTLAPLLASRNSD